MRLDILVFVLVAGYVFYRLWRVLGVRVEVERTTFSPGEVVVLRTPVAEDASEQERSQQELQALLKYEPHFNVDHFLQAAEKMLKKIVSAFAEGHVEELRRFVSPPLCEAFEAKIKEREASGQQRHVEVIFATGRVISITVPDEKHQATEPARVFVLFESEQIIYTTEADGSSYDNPAHLPVRLSDNWVFARLVGSKNPIWYVESTSAQQHPEN